jgi:hypothetical protein
LLFDLLDRLTLSDALDSQPGTSLTPLDPSAEPDQESPVLLSPGLWAAPPLTPGRSAVQVALVASADQAGRADSPTVEHTAGGDLNDTQPSTDDELDSIVSPLDPVMRLQLTAEPANAYHVCTPADFALGPAARFEANLAALLKTLSPEGRPATSEDRALLARFSGFGDSTFEPRSD